ncbi:MAG: IPT/TIG domain-containing protein [Paludibacter sp.]
MKTTFFIVIILLSGLLIGCTTETIDTTPTITTVSPSTAAAGTPIEITGKNFSTIATDNVVKINDVNVTVLSASETKLVVKVPVSTSGNLVVSTNSGISNKFNFNYGKSILIAGGTYAGAYLWNNGTAIALQDEKTGSNVANSVFATDSDVYMAGSITNSNNHLTACYWKNTTLLKLTNGSTTAEAYSIFLNGQDVYVAGYEINSDGQSVAKYWKNGTAISLANGIHDATATGIFISGSDVYVSGYEDDGIGDKAKYWKNGIAVQLSDLDHYAQTSSIYVSGTDVYVTGHVTGTYGDAVYWKNGTMVILPSGTTYGANGTSVYVKGTDVYVAGKVYIDSPQNSQAVYWKNGVKTNLTTSTNTNGEAKSIYVSDSDVYVTGNEGQYSGKYWKNGVSTTLYSSSACSMNGIIVK